MKEHHKACTSLYHVDDGGYAYRLDDVWSEPFADHDAALSAAKLAAERQRIGGRATEIVYQSRDGKWHSEHSRGNDCPDTDVQDDTAFEPAAGIQPHVGAGLPWKRSRDSNVFATVSVETDLLW